MSTLLNQPGDRAAATYASIVAGEPVPALISGEPAVLAMDFTAAERDLTPTGKAWLQEWLPTPEGARYRAEWLGQHASSFVTPEGQLVYNQWRQEPAGTPVPAAQLEEQLLDPSRAAAAFVNSLKWPRADGTLRCEDGTTLRVQADLDYRCHCWPPLAPNGENAEVPSFWSVYFNGMYYCFIPVAMVQLFMADHGGEQVLGTELSLQQVLTISVADFPEMVSSVLRPKTVSPIRCQDGSTLSVQAGADLHCEPSQNRAPWRAVQVSALSAVVPAAWAPYEDGGVYARVPVELVREFVRQHGGEMPAEVDPNNPLH